MTEPEWATASDPEPMLKYVRASDRKLRLFAVACCRQNWDLFGDRRLRRAIEVAEECADGRADEPRRAAAEAEALDACEAVYESDPNGEFAANGYAAQTLITATPFTPAVASRLAEGLADRAEWSGSPEAFDGLAQDRIGAR